MERPVGRSTVWLQGNQAWFTAVAATLLGIASVGITYQSGRIADYQNELSAAQNDVLASQRDLQAVQTALSASQTTLLEEELRILLGENQPVFEVEWCFEDKTTHGGALEYLRVYNVGTPVLDIEATAVTFMGLGQGTCRADSDAGMVVMPGYFCDTTYVDSRSRADGLVAEFIGDTQTFYSLLDEWNEQHADSGEEFFCRPYHYLELRYTDRTGAQHSQSWEVPPMGGRPVILDAEKFSVVQDLHQQALNRGATVSSFPEDMSSILLAYESGCNFAHIFYERVYP